MKGLTAFGEGLKEFNKGLTAFVEGLKESGEGLTAFDEGLKEFGLTSKNSEKFSTYLENFARIKGIILQ